MSQSKYRMAMDLSVLEHLGVNLYSTVPAVISETVANAWDADAGVVAVEIREEKGKKIIVVTDNGLGMSEKEINEKFLTVGYQRRVKDGAKTPKGRVPMGRKGIGKLSLFSIANKIEVHTLKEGGQGNALLLDHDEIRKKIKKGGGGATYYPADIKFDAIFPHKHGTRLVIRELKKRVSMMTAEALRKRLARRFGIRCINEMDIELIDGETKGKVTIDERDYFKKLEFLFQYNPGNSFPRLELSEGPFLRKFRFDKDGTPAEDGEFRVHGWIGTIQKSTDLSVDGENINKISVMMREKLALEDIMPSFGFGSAFSRYVIGEIYADFLDDGDEDIATSSRQNIIEHDPRYNALWRFLRGEVTHVGSEWNRLRGGAGERTLLADYPKLKDWLQTLKPDARAHARQIFGKINRVAMDEEHRKNLFAMGVQAFESHRLMGALKKLESVSEDNLDEFLRLATEYDEVEASLYYSITQGRLQMIKRLQKAVSKNAKERVLQKYLHNHLWLLDPSWERGTQMPSMEERVTKAFKEIDDKMSSDEKKEIGRADLKYCKAVGMHVIVELKRPSVSVRSTELLTQVLKYRDALEKCLTGRRESVEIVCVVGKKPTNWDTPQNEQRGRYSMQMEGIRVVTYDTLIDDAYRTYSEYLKAQQEHGRLREIIRDTLDEEGV